MNKIISFVINMEQTWSDFGRGWGNGYVGIPKGHPFYGLSYYDDSLYKLYDEYGLHPHGGFTYASNFNLLTKENDDDYWFFGFDTSHLGDTLDIWTKERVEEHTEEIKKMFESVIDYKLDMLVGEDG